MPTPATSFEGLGGNALQPDATGDVGAFFYIEAVNGTNGINPLVAIYDKAGKQQVSFDLNSIWKDFKGSPKNRADPTVTFDPFSQKWIVADVCYIDQVEHECIAVTKAGFDPVSGGWWLYALNVSQSGELFADYPKVAVWRDAVIVTTEELGAPKGFLGAGVWALNRQLLENGMDVKPQYFHIPDTDLATFSNVLPASYRGTRPAVDTPVLLVGQPPSSKALNVWKLGLDFATPANSALDNTPTAVSQDKDWVGTESAAQPDTTLRIGTLTQYLMQQAQYRIIDGKESLWVTSTKGDGSTAGVLWTQINVTGGTIATAAVQSNLWTNGKDGIDRFMPSLAVDKDGNMAVGYTASSTKLFPSIRWAGRLVSDPLGELAQGEATVYEGSGSQTQETNLGVPWGDYTSMSVDPSDDCTFWYVNQYFPTKTSVPNWKTRIATFKFPSCGGPAPIANVRAPLLLRDSPFTVSFSRTVKGVNSIDLVVKDLTDASLAGSIACRDINGGTVNCATGPVSTALFTPRGPLTAGSTYRVAVNPSTQRRPPPRGRVGITNIRVVDFQTGATVSQTQEVVRAQTVFTYPQYPLSYSWGTVTNGEAVGGSYVQEQYPRATATYLFFGSSLDLVMWGGPDRGTASVTITTMGQPEITQTIDTYAAAPGDKTFTWPTLTTGGHTLTISTTGTHNASSTGSWIGVDAVTVDGATTATPTLTATWSAGPGFGYRFTGQESASVSLTFYGTGVIWNAPFGPNGGQAKVTVDGVVYSTPDLYSPSYAFKDIPITGITTSPRMHTLEITALGTKQASSSDTIISLKQVTVV